MTANNASRPYGQPNPTFTATYSAFVNGETAGVLSGTLTITTTAIQTSPVGTYPITPSGQTSTNYKITFVNGTLAINPVVTCFNPAAVGKPKVSSSCSPMEVIIV